MGVLTNDGGVRTTASGITPDLQESDEDEDNELYLPAGAHRTGGQ